MPVSVDLVIYSQHNIFVQSKTYAIILYVLCTILFHCLLMFTSLFESALIQSMDELDK